MTSLIQRTPGPTHSRDLPHKLCTFPGCLGDGLAPLGHSTGIAYRPYALIRLINDGGEGKTAWSSEAIPCTSAQRDEGGRKTRLSSWLNGDID